MRRDTWIAALCCASALLAACSSTARAVVIGSSYEVPNLKPPANNPGWNNVGRVDGASAVYLGDRWVITANHVGSGDLTLSDGRVLAQSIGSSIRLKNTGSTIAPDLLMFRLAADPGLAPLALATAAPASGAQVMMIGAGVNRLPDLQGWRVSGNQWTPAPLTESNAFGYFTGSGSEMRWGMNTVSGPSTFLSQIGGPAFQTTFDKAGVPFEAQATPGDSGGGVFSQSNGGWQLAGLMLATQPVVAGEPSGVVIYGDHTDIADLSSFNQQILDLMNRPEPLWQNQANHYDVNGSGTVSVSDVMALVNEILKDGSRSLPGGPSDSHDWLDVNGDYNLGVSDLQSVVNQILRQRSAAPAAASLVAMTADEVLIVPEPTSGTLALAAFLFGLAARRWLRRR